MYKKCPVDSGNAEIITNKAIMGSIFVMERLENIFDFFSEEPSLIVAKEEENGIEEEYLCILRIRIWNRAKKSISWSIYSKDREILSNFIIRRVVWDIDEDEKVIKNKIRENRKELLELWPSIEIHNKYVPSVQSDYIIHLINNLDSEVKSGFTLHRNSNPIWEWRDLEIFRLYDWGQIHLTWCTVRKNESVEKRIKELISGLDSFLEKDDENIFKMILIYAVNPEDYKNALDRCLKKVNENAVKGEFEDIE